MNEQIIASLDTAITNIAHKIFTSNQWKNIRYLGNIR